MTLPTTAHGLLDYCQQNGIMFVDLRFTLLSGRMLHHCAPLAALSVQRLEQGVCLELDGTIDGRILLKPLLTSAAIDPFYQHPTVSLLATARDPNRGDLLPSDPRGALERAVDALRRAGITCRVGAELSFHTLDHVSASDGPNSARYLVDSREGAWRRGRDEPDNLGQQPQAGRAAYTLPPFDTLHNLRAEMVAALADMGALASGHRHGAGGAGHSGLEFDVRDPLALGDALALSKYVARNVAARHGKLVTFMPQPIHGDAGNDLVLHFELARSGQSLLGTNAQGELIGPARSIVAGMLTHLGKLAVFICPTTNSYRRIAARLADMPAIELAPVPGATDRGLELIFRAPDASSNGYLALATTLAAMLDGLKREATLDLDVRGATDRHVWTLENTGFPLTLDHALQELVDEQDCLVNSGVLDSETLEHWVREKVHNEVRALSVRPHPYEFTLYFDV